MCNMTLHLKNSYTIYKHYNCDSPNSPPNYIFTLQQHLQFWNKKGSFKGFVNTSDNGNVR
jgi:hypothetical protein